MKAPFFTGCIFLLYLTACAQVQDQNQQSPPTPRPDCEWCGAMDAPNELSWETRLAPEDEPGEALHIQGQVFMPEGKTPAPGIVVYAYHTNAEGIYPKKGDETGNGRRHGYLRGWMKTDAQGRYAFTTIRPAPYPNLGEPAHIHYTLSGEGFPEYWLRAVWFEGDSLIAKQPEKGSDRMGGFSNIIPLEKDSNGTWQGERNFILEHITD